MHTYQEWETLKAQYNWTCPWCGKSEPKIKLTEDHIIPLSRGGSNNIENIQPLCKSCNCKKSTKIISKFQPIIKN
jgi:5-methylcytosine-specific restriction endonuclease McrA